MNVFSKMLITLLIPMMLLGCEDHDEFDPNQQAFGLADNCYKLSHGNKYLGNPYGEHASHFNGYTFT